MGTVTVVVILLVIFILWPVIKGILTVYRLQRQAREAFRGFSQGAGRQASPRPAQERRAGWQRPAVRKKKIDPSQSVDVEWEEISVVESAGPSAAGSGSRQDSGPVESQIVDVEWEDITVKKQ